MMSSAFGLFTQVSGSGPLGPLVTILNTYVLLIFHAKFSQTYPVVLEKK